jgi:hypothetical protein
MEMVDMGITRFWIWGPKSRSVNNFSSEWFLDFGGISPPGAAVQTR